MADYNLGRAHGSIEIEFNGDGFERARRGFDDVSRSASESNKSMSGMATRIGNIVSALALVGPAAGAFSVALVGAVGAVAAAFISAGAAVGAFGIAVAGQIKLVKENSEAAEKLAKAQTDYANKRAVADELIAKKSKLKGKADKAAETAQLAVIQAQKAFDNQTKGMTKATKDSALAFARLKIEYESWTTLLSADTMPIVTRGLNLLRAILPKLTPLVKVAAQAFGNFLGGIEGAVKGGTVDRIVEKLAGLAESDLPALLNSVKNVGVGLGGIFGTFLPASNDASKTIEDLTEKFAFFGQTMGTSAWFSNLKDAMAEIGPEATKALGDLIQTVLNLVVALGPFLGISLQLTTALLDFTASIPSPVLSVLIGIITALTIGMKAYYAIQKIITVATKTWAAIQWVLNSALIANPIGLAIVGIVALIAVIVLIATKTDWFSKAWNAAWGWISDVVTKAVGWVVDFVKNNWDLLLGILLGPFGIAVALIIRYWDQIYGTIVTAVNAVLRFIGKGASLFVGAIAAIPGLVIKIFKNAGSWLYNAGKNIIQGLINGATALLRKLWDLFGNITRAIPNIKGPPRVDKSLLTPNGKLIMQGLIRGAESQIPPLRSMLGKIGTDVIPSSINARQTVEATQTLVSASQSGPQPMFNERRLVRAMVQAGVGQVNLDGEPLARNTSFRIGQKADLRRKTG